MKLFVFLLHMCENILKFVCKKTLPMAFGLANQPVGQSAGQPHKYMLEYMLALTSPPSALRPLPSALRFFCTLDDLHGTWSSTFLV